MPKCILVKCKSDSCYCCRREMDRNAMGIYKEWSNPVNGHVAFQHKEIDRFFLWWAEGLWRIGYQANIGTIFCCYHSERASDPEQTSESCPVGTVGWMRFLTGYGWSPACLHVIENSRSVDASMECIHLEKQIKDLEREVLKTTAHLSHICWDKLIKLSKFKSLPWVLILWTSF